MKHESTKMISSSWLTPPEIIRNLGPFSFDPCCPPCEMPWRTANIMCREDETDGLSVAWMTKWFIWLNPPYGKHTYDWVLKLKEQNNGICLICARTDTKVWQDIVFPFSSAILFLKGRLKFYNPKGEIAKNSIGAPSALIGFGKKAQAKIKDTSLKGSKWIKNNEL